MIHHAQPDALTKVDGIAAVQPKQDVHYRNAVAPAILKLFSILREGSLVRTSNKAGKISDTELLESLTKDLLILAPAIHTKVKSSVIMRLSCGNTLKSPRRARTFCMRLHQAFPQVNPSAQSRS